MMIMNIDVGDARALIALAETGSISQAACELRLTQPAVTRRVQRLEQAVGAILVDRRTRPFALTDAGRAAIERCRRLVSTADELKALAQSEMIPTREMRIGVAHALTELALFGPIEKLRSAFPALVLRLYTGWSHDLAAKVKTGALDAAVVLLPEDETPPGGVNVVKLAKEELVIIASRQWRSRKWTMRRLAETGWVLNPEGCAARAWLRGALAKAGLPLRVSVEAYNYELQMSLVARGRGLSVVPARLLARSASRSALSALRVDGLSRSLAVSLLSQEAPPSLAPALTALGDALKDEL